MSYPEDFERFWSAYPRKIGKRAAFAKWRTTAAERPAVEVLLAAIHRAAKSADWNKDGGQYVPHPTTWLNQGRWADGVAAAPQQTSKARPGPVESTLFIARRRCEERLFVRHRAGELSEARLGELLGQIESFTDPADVTRLAEAE